MNTVDLKQIFKRHFDNACMEKESEPVDDETWNELLQKAPFIFDAMKEACEKTVDLCSENAVMDSSYKSVSRESILRTKHQII